MSDTLANNSDSIALFCNMPGDKNHVDHVQEARLRWVSATQAARAGATNPPIKTALRHAKAYELEEHLDRGAK